MTMHSALHPSDIHTVSRKEGEKELARIYDCIDTSIDRHEEYIRKTNCRNQ